MLGVEDSLIRQPRQHKRRTRKRSRSNKERPSILHSIPLRSHVHDIPHSREQKTNRNEGSSHLESITCPGECQNAEEAEEVGRDGVELGGHGRAGEAFVDGGQEEGEAVDGDEDEEEVDRHGDCVDVEEGEADLLEMC